MDIFIMAILKTFISLEKHFQYSKSAWKFSSFSLWTFRSTFLKKKNIHNILQFPLQLVSENTIHYFQSNRFYTIQNQNRRRYIHVGKKSRMEGIDKMILKKHVHEKAQLEMSIGL